MGPKRVSDFEPRNVLQWVWVLSTQILNNYVLAKFKRFKKKSPQARLSGAITHHSVTGHCRHCHIGWHLENQGGQWGILHCPSQLGAGVAFVKMKFHSHPYKVGRIRPVPGQAKHSLSSEMPWQWLAARTQESPASHNQPGQRLKMIRRTKRKTLHLCMCVSSRINTGPNVTPACVLSTGKRHLGGNSLVAKLLGLLHGKQWCFSKVGKVKKKKSGKASNEIWRRH